MALLDSWLGRRFRHLGTGVEGELVKNARGFAMRTERNGEEMLEPMNQAKLMADWTDEFGPSQRLLPEEIQIIADYSDHMLRCLARHEPYLLHEIPLREKPHEVFDREFHQQVREFLRAKYNDA